MISGASQADVGVLVRILLTPPSTCICTSELTRELFSVSWLLDGHLSAKVALTREMICIYIYLDNVLVSCRSLLHGEENLRLDLNGEVRPGSTHSLQKLLAFLSYL